MVCCNARKCIIIYMGDSKMWESYVYISVNKGTRICLRLMKLFPDSADENYWENISNEKAKVNLMWPDHDGTVVRGPYQQRNGS